MTNPNLDIDAILNSVPKLSLNEDELLLIDWVLSVYRHTLPMAFDEAVDDWHSMRLGAWSAIDAIINSRSTPLVSFPINEAEARYLLAVLPTTYRWGTGPDCGYSLKRKLSCLLMGREYREPSPEMDQQPQNQSGL